MRAWWIMIILAAGLALGLLAGELVYQWASADFGRVKQITFMLANVDTVEDGERLAAESERLRPAWRWPGSEEVHFWLHRSDYLQAGVIVGGGAGVLGALLVWVMAWRRKRRGA